MSKWDRSCKGKNRSNEQQCEWKLTVQLRWWFRSYIWKSESWMYAEWYLERRTTYMFRYMYLFTVNQLIFACEKFVRLVILLFFFFVVQMLHLVTIYSRLQYKVCLQFLLVVIFSWQRLVGFYLISYLELVKR